MDHRIIELTEQVNLAHKHMYETYQIYKRAQEQVEQHRKTLNDCIIENNIKKYPIVFKIIASATLRFGVSVNTYTNYVVGYYSTLELVENAIENVPGPDEWYDYIESMDYSFEICHIQTLSDYTILDMHKSIDTSDSDDFINWVINV